MTIIFYALIFNSPILAIITIFLTHITRNLTSKLISLTKLIQNLTSKRLVLIHFTQNLTVIPLLLTHHLIQLSMGKHHVGTSALVKQSEFCNLSPAKLFSFYVCANQLCICNFTKTKKQN